MTLIYKGVEEKAVEYQFCIRDNTGPRTLYNQNRVFELYSQNWGYKIFEEGYPLDVVKDKTPSVNLAPQGAAVTILFSKADCPTADPYANSLITGSIEMWGEEIEKEGINYTDY